MKQQKLSPENYIRTRARNLPIGLCFINSDWRENGFAMITVTREHISGNLTFGTYLVDLYCLGVKDTFCEFNMPPREFDEYLENQQTSGFETIRLIKAPYALVHNIIYGGVEYAAELGFNPHKSFALTRYVLEEDDEHVKLIEIEFGFKGKPLYVSSPSNPGEAARIMAHLDKTLGRENYNFITEKEAPGFFEENDEEDEAETDFQDPAFKNELIRKFVKSMANPKKYLSESPDHFVELLATTHDIFYNYMVTEEELDEASAKAAGLFNFNITDDQFSDEFLFGKEPVPNNSKEVRVHAERIHHLIESDRMAESGDLVMEMLNRFPGVVGFKYLRLKISENQKGIKKTLPLIRESMNLHPGYLPLIQLFNASLMLAGKGQVTPESLESLLLIKHPAKANGFCREEVVVYAHLLTTYFGLTGETTLVDMIVDYLLENHSWAIPENKVFNIKMMKIPKVLDWSRNWLKSQADAGIPA